MARVIAQRTTDLFSAAAVSLIPLILVCYRILYASEPTLAAAICRPTLLAVCLMLFVVGYDSHITLSERKTLHVIGVLCGALLFTSLLAMNTERAMQEWIKLVAICSMAIMLCRPLMRRPIATAFGLSLVLCSIVLAGTIIYTYVSYMGFVIPTYPAVRVLKGAALDDDNIALNPLGFECVFTFLCGMCLIRHNRILWAVGATLLVISSVLTGSRAPLAVFLISATVLLILNGLQSGSQFLRASSALAGIALTAGVLIGLSLASPQTLSHWTEGRWDLWAVAMHKFAMHPLWGNGYLSVLDDATFLPGGYHSEYLTALAEQGAIGFAVVVYVFGCLLRRCYDVAFNPRFGSSNGQVVLFACIFLLVRASVELPGLFGTAQGPADFLAYFFLAIAMTRTPGMPRQIASSQTRSSSRLSALRPVRVGHAISGERSH